MKTYSLVGFATLAFQALLSAYLAPPWLGPWWGMTVGLGYLVGSWFLGGLYLSDIIHLGIAHRALDYKPWFIKAVTLVNNTVGVYVELVCFVEPVYRSSRDLGRSDDPQGHSACALMQRPSDEPNGEIYALTLTRAPFVPDDWAAAEAA